MVDDKEHMTGTDLAPSDLVLDRPIVLVGIMGAGKTTLGRRLAKHITVNFIDADDAIVEAAGMEIADIFASLGEAAFRDGERKVILRLLEDQPGVIATGGGAFINDETRAAILEKSICIWLDASLDVLVDRTGRNRVRPLLEGVDRREKLAELKGIRDPLYAQAHIHIDTSDSGWQDLISTLEQAIRSHMSAQEI